MTAVSSIVSQPVATIAAAFLGFFSATVLNHWLQNAREKRRRAELIVDNLKTLQADIDLKWEHLYHFHKCLKLLDEKKHSDSNKDKSQSLDELVLGKVLYESHWRSINNADFSLASSAIKDSKFNVGNSRHSVIRIYRNLQELFDLANSAVLKGHHVEDWVVDDNLKVEFCRAWDEHNGLLGDLYQQYRQFEDQITNSLAFYEYFQAKRAAWQKVKLHKNVYLTRPTTTMVPPAAYREIAKFLRRYNRYWFESLSPYRIMRRWKERRILKWDKRRNAEAKRESK